MGETYKGQLDGKGLHIGIVVSRFNQTITSRLLNGALEALIQHGVNEEDVDVARVPGSMEIPLAAKKLAQSGRYEAIICLGAVIRGETAHFEYVSSGVTQGVVQVNQATEVPIIFGVLTTDTVEQAMARSGAKTRNKGYEAAQNAIEMANLMRQLPH